MRASKTWCRRVGPGAERWEQERYRKESCGGAYLEALDVQTNILVLELVRKRIVSAQALEEAAVAGESVRRKTGQREKG